MTDHGPQVVAQSRALRAARLAARLPVTLAFLAVVVVLGFVGQGLWHPTEEQPWFEAIAYGLPAFEAGRWWTPITGTFFVVQPWFYIPTILGFIGIAILELRRGWVVAVLYFSFGQLFAVFATAAFFMAARLLPWPWAIELAGHVDVGPSGGTMACIAAAVGLLVAPWRQRVWVVVFAWAAVSLLFLGTLSDVEHAFAILLALAIDRSFRIRRTTVREQRLLAFAISLSLGAAQILLLLVPTNGPFGRTAPLDGTWLDVVVDVVVVVVVARGLRHGRRWAWVLATVWAAINVILGVALLVLSRVERTDGAITIGSATFGDVDVSIGTSVLWGAFLLYLLATRRAFGARGARALTTDRVTAPAPRVDEAAALIRQHGAGTLSWMTTWDGMQYLRTPTGIVPFQTHLGVAIVLADPLGPPEGRAESVREFIAAAERDGLIPCFFSSTQATRDAVPEGWRDLIIADDTIVDLPGLTFTGKAWSHVRQALNRADRESISFRLGTFAEQPWGVRQQLRAISEMWVGDKGLPEMRFTLGTLHEADDPEVRLALAVTESGDVDGFLSWLPVYGPDGRRRGWTLDLMRRRDDGFPAVMEFLIGSSARAFADEGALIMSLSGAPLAHQTGPGEGAIASLLSQVGTALEPVYGFQSLHHFKEKFNPRYESIYLLYRDEGDLTRIAAALTRAVLPDATLRQFAAAGVDLLRHD